MEKYLDAAEEIAEAAIVESIGTDNVRRFSGENLEHGRWRLGDDGFVGLNSNGEVSATAEFPFAGEYILRAEAKADQAGSEPAKMQFALDNKPVKVFDVKGRNRPAVYEWKLRVAKGNRKFAAAFIKRLLPSKSEKPARARPQSGDSISGSCGTARRRTG